MARPKKPKVDPAIQTELTTVLTGGATVKDACDYVGITTDTFYQWCKRYPDFADATKKARAGAKVACVAQIRQAAKSEWQAAAWFLERSDPTNWGRKDMLISLGIDPALLRNLKQQADASGVNIAEVFEAMINEFANVSAADSEK